MVSERETKTIDKCENAIENGNLTIIVAQKTHDKKN